MAKTRLRKLIGIGMVGIGLVQFANGITQGGWVFATLGGAYALIGGAYLYVEGYANEE